MMGEGNVERSKIRIVAIDRTPTSETDGLGETHTGLPLPEFSHGTWEAEVGSLPASFCSTADHPSVPTCAAPAGARSGGQGWPVFGPPPSAARSVLDGREHDGRIVRRRGPRSATRTDPAIRKLARRVIKKRAHAHGRIANRQLSGADV